MATYTFTPLSASGVTIVKDKNGNVYVTLEVASLASGDAINFDFNLADFGGLPYLYAAAKLGTITNANIGVYAFNDAARTVANPAPCQITAAGSSAWSSASSGTQLNVNAVLNATHNRVIVNATTVVTGRASVTLTFTGGR